MKMGTDNNKELDRFSRTDANLDDLREIYSQVAQAFKIVKDINDKLLLNKFPAEYEKIQEIKHEFFSLEYMLSDSMIKLKGGE